MLICNEKSRDQPWIQCFLGKRRYNIKLWKTFTDCFNCLPIAAIGKLKTNKFKQQGIVMKKQICKSKLALEYLIAICRQFDAYLSILLN